MKISAIVAAVLLCAPVAVHAADWSPTADDLVSQLRPHANGVTRGIRALPGPVAATPNRTAAVAYRPVAATGHVVAPAAPAQSAEEPSQANLNVQFQNGSDRLTPGAMHMLDELGRALTSPQLSGFKFRIVGHTDSVGGRDYNQALSERRANAVTAYLTKRYSIDTARLSTVGMGEAEPLVPAAEGVPEARNRRVQVINIGA